MTVDVNLLAGFLMAALVGGGIAYLAQRRVKQNGVSMSLPSYSAWMELMNKVSEQEKQIGELQNQVRNLQADVEGWRKEADNWKRRYEASVVLVDTMSQQLLDKRQRTGRAQQKDELLRPLLFLRPDTTIGRADEFGIEIANIGYLRLADCTKQEIENEIARRQQDANLYQYVHISAHGGTNGDGKRGIYLANQEFVDGAWLAKTFRGVKIVFLNACTTVDLADALVGSVDYVIVTYESIDEENAGKFAQAFWREIGRGKTPDQAFELSLAAVHDIANYVDMRRRR